MLPLVLILAAVMLLACHAFGLGTRVHLGWLGVAFLAAGVWLVPVAAHVL